MSLTFAYDRVEEANKVDNRLRNNLYKSFLSIRPSIRSIVATSTIERTLSSAYYITPKDIPSFSNARRSLSRCS